jgi:hypothetical protein
MQANPEGDEMKNWLRRMRGAIGMGVTWAVGWAAFGILIGVSSLLLPGLPWDRFFEVFDAPLPAMAVPGFFAGAIFSVVLAVAGRRKRFDELSLPRFAAWGAVGGLMLSLLPAAMVSVGLATPRAGLNLWGITAVISGPLILLTSLSATGSLILARKAEGRKVREVGEGAAAAIGEGGVTTSSFRQSTAKDTTDTNGQARGWPG